MQITREHDNHHSYAEQPPQYWGFKDENGDKIIENVDRRDCLLCRENARESDRLYREIGRVLQTGVAQAIYKLLRKDFLKDLATYNTTDLHIEYDKFPKQASTMIARYAKKIAKLIAENNPEEEMETEDEDEEAMRPIGSLTANMGNLNSVDFIRSEPIRQNPLREHEQAQSSAVREFFDELPSSRRIYPNEHRRLFNRGAVPPTEQQPTPSEPIDLDQFPF